jgi:phosphatidate phosphatase APP1
MHACRRLLRLLSRPVRGDRGRGGVVVQSYRGFGSLEASFLMGRVFRQEGRRSAVHQHPLVRNIIDLLRRLFRKGVSRAVLEIRLDGTRKQVTADGRGHFQVHLRHQRREPDGNLWHPVTIQLVRPPGDGSSTQAEIFVPPVTAKFAVISDIDDTVVYTGVANKLMMTWRLFVEKAKSRTAFPGVAAFYRALHLGSTGREMNPMLYVSRGPWTIYELLDEFFHLHAIPVGPVLFLRDWKLAIYRPFPPRARGHKRRLIRRMLLLYHKLPFILIGDSGQHDPEIYLDVVRGHPGRILAIYIRNITGDALRDRVIAKLAREVTRAGSNLLLASDSFDMAMHAADNGFIASAALAEVLKERREQRDERSPTVPPVEIGNRAP